MPVPMLRLLVLSTTALAGNALAQVTAGGVTALDAVTATATRTPEVAGAVAAPITIVAREEILRR